MDGNCCIYRHWWGVVCFGTSSVDFINRILFAAKIVFLVIILALMMPHVEQQNLLAAPTEKYLFYLLYRCFYLLWFSW